MKMRDEILELAGQQLMTGGFAKLNFATIAKELDTTRANLHYHFNNKESLAIEVIKKYEQFGLDYYSSLKIKFKGDFFGFVKAIDDGFWEYACNLGSTSICPATKIVSEKDLPKSLSALSKEFFQKSTEIIAKAIQEAIDNGQIRKDINAQREALKARVIILGIMQCGQYLINMEDAEIQLKGMLIEWANSLK